MIWTECRRPWLIYAKAKLKDTELRAFKRALNSYNYVNGSMFQEIVSDQRNSDDSILTKVFTSENLSCNSMIELPYYTCKIFKSICVYCGKTSRLITSTENYPKCVRCSNKEPVKFCKTKGNRKK